jgi:hypothetical protein
VNAVNKQNKELIVKNIDLQEQLLIQRVRKRIELSDLLDWHYEDDIVDQNKRNDS